MEYSFFHSERWDTLWLEGTNEYVNVEDDSKWVTEDTDKYFYGIEEKEKSTSELLKEGMDLQIKLEEENE